VSPTLLTPGQSPLTSRAQQVEAEAALGREARSQSSVRYSVIPFASQIRVTRPRNGVFDYSFGRV